MNEILVTLALAYLMVVGLLLLVLIHSPVRWWLKLVLIMVVTGFGWFSYLGWKHSQGWPALVEVPDKFLLHFAVIEEPDDDLGTEGAIFLWLTDLYQNRLAAEPRAYRLPYDQPMHAKVESAMRRAKAGNLQLGIRKGGDDLPEVKQYRKELGDHALEIEFIPVPDPELPEK